MNVSSITSSIYAKTAYARKLLGTALLASSTALSGCAIKIDTRIPSIYGEMYAPIIVDTMPVIIHPRPWIGHPRVIFSPPVIYNNPYNNPYMYRPYPPAMIY